MRSFLQTTEWLEFQKEAGHKAWRFDDGTITANIIKYNLPFGKSYLYVPHGPEINFDNIKGGLKNELANFIKYLKDLAREEKAIFVKIEPLSDVVIEMLHVKGMRRSNKQIQPYKTVVLGLTLSEEHLLGKMHTKTRYNIKVAEKHGITVKPSQDIDLFWKLMKKTTKRDRFSSHSKEYYKKLLNFLHDHGEIKTDLILAYHGDRPVAGAIVLQYGDTGYYLHGASDYAYRAMMAPYALHWEIIKLLKNNETKRYDLWGVDAARWPGVTRFKLGWLGLPRQGEEGNKLIEYPGSFDIPVSRSWYLIYNLARRIF